MDEMAAKFNTFINKKWDIVVYFSTYMKKNKANEEEKRHPNRVSHHVYVGPLKYFQEGIESLEVLRWFPAVFQTLSEAHLWSWSF